MASSWIIQRETTDSARRYRVEYRLGQRDISVTADVYSHVLADETELDYSELTA